MTDFNPPSDASDPIRRDDPVWGQGQQPPPQYGFPSQQTYPRQSQATTALVLSILGFFCCGVTAVIGMVIGRQDVKAIDDGLTEPSNRGTAQAAFIVGLIASILAGGMLLLYLLLIFLSAAESLG